MEVEGVEMRSTPHEAPAAKPERRARARRTTGKNVPTRRTIVHITAEYYPYARTGGLAEAVAGLAAHQARAEEGVVVFMPLYPHVRAVAPDLVPLQPLIRVAVGARTEEVRFFVDAANKSGPFIIFVDAPGYFTRSGLYGESGSDYPDNHVRFALFARAVLAGVRQFVPGPVLLHLHDWHAALASLFLRAMGAEMPFGPTPVVLSVHNAGYQGHYQKSAIKDLGIPDALWTPDKLEWYGQFNLLKAGLTYCDVAVTVSPSHARELCTPEGGFGLHGTFQHMGERLVGICNGIDEDVWNPATDPAIAARYSREELDGKAACKKALQLTLGLAHRPDVPLFGMSARLAKQKGFELILKSASLRSPNAQFVFLGTGDMEYQDALSAIARERPDQVAVEFAFTDLLEHRLIAGSDAILMPSLYEPCGLTQMRAQRYGAPVVGRRTGGITDTVDDGETGFLFDEFTPEAFDEAMERAMERFANRSAWKAMMRRGMACDFGWERAERQYRDVYDSAERLALAAG